MTARGGGCQYVVTVRHVNDADRAKHEEMGFHDGWGTAADQLGDLAASL
ncbi:SRPBCC domain-containing protein [Cognatiyoonia sp. IB215182]|nr:SRPBCC domain-containing protein [Cognatiyoonia sp. IB215182]MDX8350811.1 SRPBCC domain-containing protein [Cognatiyoonia sp. IB215182]